MVEPLLHLCSLADDLAIGQAAPAPAKPLLRASSLKDNVIMTPFGSFIDKILPVPTHQLHPRETYTATTSLLFTTWSQLLVSEQTDPHTLP